ncbi:MAG: WYL domain-containing protein [Lachnospiraceae bacterium]|nr:WYL domain-containing protein [Lachnospiraceae bacterium]
MPKSENQKLKIMYIAKILKEETDEDHPISIKTMIERLSALDIKAERKSLYSDLQSLRDFGMDIDYIDSKKNGGYYLVERDFELAELKILVDMVQSSRFLTEKKSRELIKKLENMAGKYEAGELQRSVFVTGRAKAGNEKVYYSVDKIHRAIRDDKSIRFQYMDYSVGKELTLRKSGAVYEVSPFYLTWNTEQYYLVGVDEKIGEIRHYRVDRMKAISLTDKERKGKDLFQGFDIADYSNATFGMFGGEKRKVQIQFQNELAGVVLDRFGLDTSLRKKNETTFTVSVSVVPSQQFFGWLAGLGTRAKLLGPADVREEFHDFIGNIYKNY